MPRSSEGGDNRQFGRRTTLWHAWIIVAGRERETCIIRNFSVAGALLEFDHIVPSVDKFKLVIDEYGFEVACYVKHRSRFALGVYFTEIDEHDRPTGRGTAADVVIRAQRDH